MFWARLLEEFLEISSSTSTSNSLPFPFPTSLIDMFGHFGCLTLIYHVNKTPNEHVYAFLSNCLTLCTFSCTMCMLVIPLILGMVTSLTNGIRRSSCHNHKMIVGDGRGSNTDRRSQLRPDLRLNLHFQSVGFPFGPLDVVKPYHLNKQISCGVSASRRCSLMKKSLENSDSSH